MDLSLLTQHALSHIPHQRSQSPQFIQPLPGLGLIRYHQPTSFEATIYEPVICLIIQGMKETSFGDRTFGLTTGSFLLISHDLPILSRVMEVPYLALLLDIKLPMLRSLYDEVEEAGIDTTPTRALEIHRADEQILDALYRYLQLANSPMDAKVLGPLILKEIHYRMLMAPFGQMLRSLLRYDSPASAIARAISHIRSDFQQNLAIPELAERVGMSASTFHKHFRAITCSTPLQYQKDLRLMEARRLLRTGRATVSNAAYEVGYESANQFSREYARKFGVPPSRDLAHSSAMQAVEA